MRISQKTTIEPYQSTLNSLQKKQFDDNTRLTTKRNIVDLADAPDDLTYAKNLSAIITQNKSFIDVIDQTVSEMNVMEESAQNISDTFNSIRTISIDATLTGASGNLFSLGVNLKGYLTDLLSDANVDFGGKFSFSGTKTTVGSLTQTEDSKTDLPFELIEGEKTADNPSGLKVVFKGNNNERMINKEQKSTEVINITASEIFGGDGTEIFSTVIDMYNKLTYDDQGNLRDTNDVFSTADIAEISDMQAKIATQNEKLINAISRLGAKSTRLTTLSSQMASENVTLEGLKSAKYDTDYAQVVSSLKLTETALNYTLAVGAKMFNTSLLDFLG